MNNKNSVGFVFLMTLITIVIISLLVLGCMQHVLLYYKAINQQKVQHQRFYQLEKLALQLARTQLVDLDGHCVNHEDSANQVIQNLMKDEGCTLSVDKNNYRYFIEEPGEYACLVVEVGHKKYATVHRRVSLLSIIDDQPAALLQIRYIRPTQPQPCLGEEHRVTLGISSWRYFPAIIDK